MTAANPALAQRARFAVGDAWVTTLRDLQHWQAQPGTFLVNLLFPVMTFLMFAFLFGGAMTVPGGGDYREFLVPGMLTMTVVFGLEATFTAVATDAQRGVTDRFRTLPMAPSAVVVGRSVADMLGSVAGLAVLMASALAVGWRWHNGLAAAAGAFGLLLLLRFALIWAGIHLALVLGRPEAVVALQILVWPLGFLSSVFVPPQTMPGWLALLAEWNPVSATASAVRELFGNPGWGGDSWIAQHSMLMAVVWPLVILAVCVPGAVRAYRRLSR